MIKNIPLNVKVFFLVVGLLCGQSDIHNSRKTAITKAIDDWEEQLSDRQKKRINAQGRLDQLKQAVADATPPQVDPPAVQQRFSFVKHRRKDGLHGSIG